MRVVDGATSICTFAAAIQWVAPSTKAMDKPLPPDFDPTKLVDEPMSQVQQPREGDEKNDQDKRSLRNRPDGVEDFMHFVPASLKRLIVAGSCCTGVAALYVLTSWDHGWIPGIESQFALASDLRKSNQEMTSMKSDVNELYILSIARAIRDLQDEMCEGWTRSKADRLEELQYKYERRTGSRYPHTGCH